MGALLLQRYLQGGDFKAGKLSAPLTCHRSKSHKLLFVTKLTSAVIMKQHFERFFKNVKPGKYTVGKNGKFNSVAIGAQTPS